MIVFFYLHVYILKVLLFIKIVLYSSYRLSTDRSICVRRILADGSNMENRKQGIIDATINLFCERGLDLTSMQDIANAVGITKSTIYFYFDSKAELIQEVFEYCHQKDVDACNEGLEQEKSAIDKLCKRFDNIVNYSITHRKEAMIERLYYSSPVYGNKDANCDRQFYRDVEKIMLEGRKDGSIIDEPVWLLTTMYYGLASQVYLRFVDNQELWNEETKRSSHNLIRNLFQNQDR